MPYLSFLESLLAEAGEIALSFPPRMRVRVKDSDANQVVTDADIAIGDHIRRRIRDEHPHDSTIDEELGAVPGESSITWVVDPIDGTSNFAAGTPLYGIMVGVLDHGEPRAGGVTLPALPETYVAEAGHGAYLDGARLKIDQHGDLAQELVAYGMDVHPSEVDLDCRILNGIANQCSGVRISNSIFDCMMVAKGAYGVFMHRRNRIWDCVAGQVIIQEAGGVFSTMTGNPIDYTDPLRRTEETFSMLACAPHFHQAMTKTVMSATSRYRTPNTAAPVVVT
jgi:myo-inositol-1(or 4)-monophosphatase